MARFDAVIVGSGINSLACGALLARGGWSVCVLERNDWLGGAIKTAEITEPGFQHDVFSAWHPLWVGGAAHAILGDELGARGLEYLNTELPTGTLFPDGEAAFLLRTADANAAELDRHSQGDGAAWRRYPRRLLAECRPLVRAPRHRALVGSGSRAGREGDAAPRTPRPRRVRRERAHFEPRLARGHVRLGTRARPARTLGAPHRSRAGRRLLRVHDPGDRGRDPGRRACPCREAGAQSSPKRSSA